MVAVRVEKVTAPATTFNQRNIGFELVGGGSPPMNFRISRAAGSTPKLQIDAPPWAFAKTPSPAHETRIENIDVGLARRPDQSHASKCEGMAISTARKSPDPKCATNTQTRQIIWPRSRHRTDWRRQNNPKSMYFCWPGTPKPADQKIATNRPPIHTLNSRRLAWPEADAKQTELFRMRPSLHNAHHRQRPPKRTP